MKISVKLLFQTPSNTCVLPQWNAQNQSDNIIIYLHCKILWFYKHTHTKIKHNCGENKNLCMLEVPAPWHAVQMKDMDTAPLYTQLRLLRGAPADHGKICLLCVHFAKAPTIGGTLVYNLMVNFYTVLFITLFFHFLLFLLSPVKVTREKYHSQKFTKDKNLFVFLLLFFFLLAPPHHLVHHTMGGSQRTMEKAGKRLQVNVMED